MPKKRTPEEVRQAFDNHMNALEASSKGFDEGKQWEAMRLATAIYTLFHDGGIKKLSILTQMGMRDSLLFVTTGPAAPKKAPRVAWTPLVVSEVWIVKDKERSPPKFVPISQGGSVLYDTRLLKFRRWWDGPIFISGDGKRKITRKWLVFNLRNKEGGSHFDSEITSADYIDMIDNINMKIGVGTGGQPEKIEDVAGASMRQVAWEILKTFEEAGLYSPKYRFLSRGPKHIVFQDK